MWLEGFFNPVLADFLFYLLVMLILFLIFKILKYLNRNNTVFLGSLKNHSWRSTENLSQACYCNNCESLILDGFYCDSCGVCAERRCLKKVTSKIKCKEISSNDGQMKHQWLKGNLPLNSTCYVCSEECNVEHGLLDFKCIWCHRCVHGSCKNTLGKVCDFGKFRAFILPPNCVVLGYRRPRVKSTYYLESVQDPGWSKWTPIFVLGNSKSGNNKAGEVLSAIRGCVNPFQVVDLSVSSPSSLIESLKVLPKTANPRLIVAGGDGSVAWLLSDLANLSPDETCPPVGIIPLGTGNDLSRVLGWGSKEPNIICPEKIFELIEKAKPVSLDRWSVDIKSQRHLRFTKPLKNYFMYNYLSIGVDALVTLKFHNTRQSRFYVFSSRIINKLMYLAFGTEQVLERNCKNLEDKVEVYLDGVRVDLPAIESIVILNIPYWGAGVPLWSVGSGETGVMEQKIDDGKLEVAAIYSSFHIAQLQVGLSEPHRIGQAQQLKLKLKSKMPMQIDGEPWMQSPCEINIKLFNQASVLELSE